MSFRSEGRSCCFVHWHDARSSTVSWPVFYKFSRMIIFSVSSNPLTDGFAVKQAIFVRNGNSLHASLKTFDCRHTSICTPIDKSFQRWNGVEPRWYCRTILQENRGLVFTVGTSLACLYIYKILLPFNFIFLM